MVTQQVHKTVQPLEDREALYYPYVHIRDEDWLKKTLLVFPGLVRMIGKDFVPEDSPLVRALSEGDGKKRLMRSANLSTESQEVGVAQHQLKTMIEEDLSNDRAGFLAAFGRTAAAELNARQGTWLGFQMDMARSSPDLAGFLERNGLAWTPAHPDRAEYFELHPQLGRAVLGMIAVACARDEGLDIVAHSEDEPSRTLNSCLALNEVGAVYETFVRGKPLTEKPAISDTALLEAVVYQHCDVSKLDAKGLLRLADEREALRTLQSELHSIATRLPTMDNRRRMDEWLQTEADRVLARWKADRANLSKYAREIFSTTSTVKGGGAILAKAIEKFGLAGTSGAFAATSEWQSNPVYALGAGLAIGFVVYTVASISKVRSIDAKSNFRYLTSAAKEGVVFSVGR